MFIRAGRKILDVDKNLVHVHKTYNSAKRHSRELQIKGLGIGQLKLRDKLPKGDYMQVQE